MSSSCFSIFSGKYFNQNLICTILSYMGVYFAHKDKICYLCHVSKILLLVSLFSLSVTIVFYTYEYCRKKVYKSKSHKLRYKYNEQLSHNKSINKDTNGKLIVEW